MTNRRPRVRSSPSTQVSTSPVLSCEAAVGAATVAQGVHQCSGATSSGGSSRRTSRTIRSLPRRPTGVRSARAILVPALPCGNRFNTTSRTHTIIRNPRGLCLTGTYRPALTADLNARQAIARVSGGISYSRNPLMSFETFSPTPLPTFVAGFGTKGGDGSASHDQPYTFGRQPQAQAKFPFTPRQYARLLIVCGRIRDELLGVDDVVRPAPAWRLDGRRTPCPSNSVTETR